MHSKCGIALRPGRSARFVEAFGGMASSRRRNLGELGDTRKQTYDWASPAIGAQGAGG